MNSIKYIDREGLENLSEFIASKTEKGLKNLRLLEREGIEIWNGYKVIKKMDSLGNNNVFIIANPWQMTSKECENTVQVLNVILGTKWSFKEKIHTQMNIRREGE